MSWKKWLLSGLGALAFVGVDGEAKAQSRQSVEEPAHEVLAVDSGIELRDYAPMIVAEVVIVGDQRRMATGRGFQRLAAYIFAQDRPGAGRTQSESKKIAMTSPVLQDQTQKIAMTSPVMQDSMVVEGAADSGPTQNNAWRTRFVMPAEYTMATLPEPPADITLTEMPARRVAAIMFNGYGTSDDLEMMEARLRGWMEEKGHQASGPVEYAFYDGPWVRPQQRRNEVIIPVASDGKTED